MLHEEHGVTGLYAGIGACGLRQATGCPCGGVPTLLQVLVRQLDSCVVDFAHAYGAYCKVQQLSCDSTSLDGVGKLLLLRGWCPLCHLWPCEASADHREAASVVRSQEPHRLISSTPLCLDCESLATPNPPQPPKHSKIGENSVSPKFRK
eukprot:5843970-Amphidinium_carterae.1